MWCEYRDAIVQQSRRCIVRSRSWQRRHVWGIGAIILVLCTAVVSVFTANAVQYKAIITATLLDASTIRVTGTGFPPSVLVKVKYDFAGTSQVHDIASSTAGNITDDMQVAAGFVGTVKIAASSTKVGEVSASTPTPATQSSGSTTSKPSVVPNQTASTLASASVLQVDPAGEAFYVDCNAASSGDGSQARPWKDPSTINGMTLPAGAVVNFQPGCTWNGYITLNAQATAAHPVVLRANPNAQGPMPTFTAENAVAEYETQAIMTVKSPYVGVEGLHFTNNHGVGIQVDGDNSKVVGVSVDNVGLGVWVAGDDTNVSDTNIRDLHIVRSTPGGDDDFGAVGFNVEAVNVTIQNSSCTNCIAPSPDYGTDGGFVEVWKKGDGLQVLNNTAKNTNGFFEIGGEGGSDSANNVLVRGNSIDNCQGVALTLNTSGKFAMQINNLRFEKNTIVDPQNKAYLGNSDAVTATNNTLNGLPM